MGKDITAQGSYASVGIDLPDPDIRTDLKDWRTRMGFTQGQAAAALGMKLRTYHRIEAQGYVHEHLLRLAIAQIEGRGVPTLD